MVPACLGKYSNSSFKKCVRNIPSWSPTLNVWPETQDLKSVDASQPWLPPTTCCSSMTSFLIKAVISAKKIVFLRPHLSFPFGSLLSMFLLLFLLCLSLLWSITIYANNRWKSIPLPLTILRHDIMTLFRYLIHVQNNVICKHVRKYKECFLLIGST